MMRWMSPERIFPDRFGFEDGRATKESDCYTLGMVILEVLTGQVPFPSDHDIDAMWKVVNGERPMRPRGPEAVWFTDDLWGMLEQCWSPRPEVRPTAGAILEHLKQGAMVGKPLPRTANGFQVSSDDDSQSDDSDDPQSNDKDNPQSGGNDNPQSDDDDSQPDNIGFQLEDDGDSQLDNYDGFQADNDDDSQADNDDDSQTDSYDDPQTDNYDDSQSDDDTW